MKNKPVIFLLTREQWIGVVILLVLAAVTLLLLHRFQPAAEPPVVSVADSTLTAFSHHQARHDSLRQAQWRKQHPRDIIALRLQPFDPNTADSSTLLHLGLKPWQASNMLKYRAKHGRYRRAEDMRKLYGMTDSMYQVLLPYIQIDTLAVRLFRDSLYRAQYGRLSSNRADSDTTVRDTMPHYVSYKRDTILNLRTADTTALKMIRGIGSYRANQIVRYRARLGGFASVEQLREIGALRPLLSDSLSADSLLMHFVLDSVVIRPLRLNSASVSVLQRHPYLSFEQAKAIYELRRRKIRLDSIAQLQRLNCLSEDDLLRIRPYLSFE